LYTTDAHIVKNSVTLEEIESAEHLVLSLEKIELPNQLVAVLADPLLQKFLLLRPGDDADARVNNWLKSFIKDANSEQGHPDDLVNILEILRSYAQCTKVCGVA
jgi:centromere protein I